jgi:hypothetical protein
VGLPSAKVEHAHLTLTKTLRYYLRSPTVPYRNLNVNFTTRRRFFWLIPDAHWQLSSCLHFELRKSTFETTSKNASNRLGFNFLIIMASPSSMVTRPIGNRKLDILYIVFLSAVAFFPLILDFVPFYPIELPSWAKTPYNFYSTQYNDPLFMNHPPFFQLYVFIEAFYLVPMALYGINGLLNG